MGKVLLRKERLPARTGNETPLRSPKTPLLSVLGKTFTEQCHKLSATLSRLSTALPENSQLKTQLAETAKQIRNAQDLVSKLVINTNAMPEKTVVFSLSKLRRFVNDSPAEQKSVLLMLVHRLPEYLESLEQAIKSGNTNETRRMAAMLNSYIEMLAIEELKPVVKSILETCPEKNIPESCILQFSKLKTLLMEVVAHLETEAATMP